MSQAFKPVKLDAASTKEALAMMCRAIVLNPIPVVLSLLLMFGFILLDSWVDGLATTPLPVVSGLLSALFLFFSMQLPAVLGAFLIFNVGARQTLSDFLATLFKNGHYRKILITFSAHVVILSIIFGMTSLFFSGTEAGTTVQEGLSTPFWMIALGYLLFAPMLLSMLVTMNAVEVVKTRLGREPVAVFHYWDEAKALNQKAYYLIVAIITGLSFLVLLFTWSYDLIILSIWAGQIVASMLWAYVLFSNTFPPKAHAKEMVLKPVSQNN